MGNFSLTCLGVGDGWACADRNHAAFLYRLGKTTLLVDCGEPVGGAFKATGLPCDLIDSIFISHLHSDHLGGFFMLMQGFWLERRRKELPVHLPADGIKPIGAVLNLMLLFKELLHFGLRFKPLRAERTVLQGNVRVTPFRSSHLEGLRRVFQRKHPQSFEAFSFLIETPRFRIGHSADIGRPEDLAPLLRQPLDLLVCELAHFAPAVLFRYLKGRDIKRIVFVHLARRHWENLARIRGLAAKMLPGVRITFARDGDAFDLR